MLKRITFEAEFSDIGWMPVEVSTYRQEIKKAIADYVNRMKDIGVVVIATANAKFK